MPQHASPSHAFASHPGFVTHVVRHAFAHAGRRLTHRTLSEESFLLPPRSEVSRPQGVDHVFVGSAAAAQQPLSRRAAALTAYHERGEAARRSQSTGTRRSTAVSTIGARADASHCRRRSSRGRSEPSLSYPKASRPCCARSPLLARKPVAALSTLGEPSSSCGSDFWFFSLTEGHARACLACTSSARRARRHLAFISRTADLQR